MFFGSSGLFLAFQSALTLAAGSYQFSKTGFSYDSLPARTLFPGPWEAYIQAPANKTHIKPVAVRNVEGDVRKGHLSLLAEATGHHAVSIGPGGLITLDFGQNIAGR
jgi:hypothetical protein